MLRRWALLPISFRIPRKKPSNRTPAKRDAPFPEPSSYLIKFPFNGLLWLRNGPLQKDTPVSRAFIFTLPPNSPVNEPRFHVPQKGPYGEKLHLQPQWFIHSLIYISQSPQKGILPWKMWKTFCHCPQNPTWMENLHTMGCGLVPQGNRLQHCSLYPRAMQPLAW